MVPRPGHRVWLTAFEGSLVALGHIYGADADLIAAIRKQA
jgi:hypothetical protein